MRILLALGGNALLRRGEPASAPNRRRNVETAAAALAGVAAEHELIVTHGNGPQVGIGHMLELALRNLLPERDVVSVLTEVVVADDDPAFRRPTKPIGPNLVPSPEPYAISEIRSLRVLVDSGALVICADGGIPVALDGVGTMREVEAVVDRDLTSALLARRLDAEMLVMLTGVDAVRADWGGPRERPIVAAEPRRLREMDFAAGSMGPKVEAACRFADTTGHRAAIGSLTDVARMVRGEAGTQVADRAAVPSRLQG